jgi:hypothetical protein
MPNALSCDNLTGLHDSTTTAVLRLGADYDCSRIVYDVSWGKETESIPQQPLQASGSTETLFPERSDLNSGYL